MIKIFLLLVAVCCFGAVQQNQDFEMNDTKVTVDHKNSYFIPTKEICNGLTGRKNSRISQNDHTLYDVYNCFELARNKNSFISPAILTKLLENENITEIGKNEILKKLSWKLITATKFISNGDMKNMAAQIKHFRAEIWHKTLIKNQIDIDLKKVKKELGHEINKEKNLTMIDMFGYLDSACLFLLFAFPSSKLFGLLFAILVAYCKLTFFKIGYLMVSKYLAFALMISLIVFSNIYNWIQSLRTKKESSTFRRTKSQVLKQYGCVDEEGNLL